MQKSILMLSLVLAAWTGSQTAQAQQSKEVMVGINDVYIPGGFDSASDAFVVVNGVYQNGCYRWSRADINHKGLFEHEVRTYANVSQGMCIMVLVPYQKEVRLGTLASGKHTLRFVNGDGTYLEKSMEIE